jgi:hypothetical protein
MRYASILILLLILAACSTGAPKENTTDGGGIDPESEQLETQAYEATGDVRVFYYVKNTLVPGSSGHEVEQEEQRSVLLNKSHTFYRGVPDHQMKKEERFLQNSDMYDLLKILKELGFFGKGASVNIFADDPVERADNERTTTRMIAVETIKDGKVNTSYFARRSNEHEADPARAKMFNECQAVMMQAIAGALPRGDAGYGEGDTSNIHERR